MSQKGLARLAIGKFRQGPAVFFTKRQVRRQIIDSGLLVGLDIFLVYIIEITEARFGDIVKQAQLQYPPDIRLSVETRQTESDHRGAKGMFCNRFGAGTEKLKSGAGGSFEHADFKKEMCQILHRGPVLKWLFRYRDAAVCDAAQALTDCERLSILNIKIATIPFCYGYDCLAMETIIMTATRIEKDSMGTMEVPASALYGAQTARALVNFPISGQRFSRPFIRALGLIKRYAAQANLELGMLDEQRAKAIMQAADEVINGELDEHFVLDIFQTGSGTSTNMNANEVIANRAAQILGKAVGSRAVHPNDHVNLGQSSNDVIPTAIHIATALETRATLVKALFSMQEALGEKALAFNDIIKIGRTHLQDATPVRLGQVFSGYARQLALAIRSIENAAANLLELALGGTAVGTGLNTHPRFASRVIAAIADETGLAFREASNHFEAQAAKDALVEASGALKRTACALFKIANDIRLLGSGPRCGIGELLLPPVQPGSSIMPGKVNPVMAESLMQVCGQVVGNDAAITLGGLSGNFELNVMMPLMAHNLLQSIALLAAAATEFTKRCLTGLEADRGRCESLVEQSLAMCTALAPVIGYDRAADIAKQAYASGRTVREIAMEQQVLPEEKLARILDPRPMTEAGIPGKTR